MNDIVDVSVVVPHYQDLERLDRCLAALEQQSMARDRYEIIVADNMSACGPDAVRCLIAGRARLVLAPERGAGPARNAAVSAARGGVLAFTDADCVPAPDWLSAGIAALDGSDIVGGSVTLLFEGSGIKTGAEAYEAVFAFNNRRYIEREGFSVTANLFCRRHVYDVTGPFRVGLSEDKDWCHRASALGFRIAYESAALVAHPARLDWPALLKKWRRLNAELFANVQARPGGRMRWLLASLAMPLSIIAHLPRIVGSPALLNRQERQRGAVTLARLRLWRCADGMLRLMGARA